MENKKIENLPTNELAKKEWSLMNNEPIFIEKEDYQNNEKRGDQKMVGRCEDQSEMEGGGSEDKSV